MAEAKQPSSWGWAASPSAGGTVTISYNSSTTTFTAVASSGYRFDHWTFTPWSGSSSAPGQWMPGLKQQLSNNLTSNPHVSSRFTYDPEENPEYNQAGIFATAYFVQTGPGPGPTPTTYSVSAFRFNNNLDAYVTLNGDTDRLIVSKDLEAGAAVDIMFSSPDPTVVFQGWYRLAPGDPEATGGVLVSTNPHYTTTVRTDGANSYRANIQSALVNVWVDGMYDGAVSINGENDGTRTVLRSVPIGVPCTLSAEPVVQSGFGALIFVRWLMFSDEEHQYIEVSRNASYTFTPDGTKQNYNFSTEWAQADSLTVSADPPRRGSVSRSPAPDVGDEWYSEDTLNSPGVTLTATPRPSAKFLYWCYIGSSGRDIIESREPVTTVHDAHDYIARFGPSDLLVNTYNRAAPVKLVHDPATNLLVADY